jgi:hypothetical protein
MRETCLSLTIGLFLILSASVSFSLEKPTHSAINEKIVKGVYNGFSFDTFLRNYLGLSDGEITFLNNKEAYKWVSEGGITEDEPAYGRSRNHFHNPLLPWDQAGLDSGFTGKSLILWAKDQSARRATDVGGDWSWKIGRKFYYAALIGDSTALNGVMVEEGWFRFAPIVGKTNMAEAERNQFFAWTFRSVFL